MNRWLLLKNANINLSAKVVAFGLLLSFSMAIQAQSLTMPKIVETYVGGNYVYTLDPRLNQGSGDFGTVRDSKITQPQTLMVRWGYREEQQYAIELGYMITPSWDATADNGVRITQKSSGFLADLFFFFPLSPQAMMYLKIGTAFLTNTGIVENKPSSDGLYYETLSATRRGWAGNYGIGLEYLMDPALAFRIGYETIDIDAGELGKPIYGGLSFGAILFYE